MAKPEQDLTRALLMARPLAPRFQLIAAPVLLYLLSIVGSPGWWWIADILLAVVFAWLGSQVLLGRTLAWWVLTICMIGVLVATILDLVGVNHDFPLWQDVLALILVAVVVQALITVPTRPSGEVRDEIVRRWPLVLTGLTLMVVLLSTDGDADAGELEQAASLFVGLALAIWLILAWRAFFASPGRSASRRPRRG